MRILRKKLLVKSLFFLLIARTLTIVTVFSSVPARVYPQRPERDDIGEMRRKNQDKK